MPHKRRKKIVVSVPEASPKNDKVVCAPEVATPPPQNDEKRAPMITPSPPQNDEKKKSKSDIIDDVSVILMEHFELDTKTAKEEITKTIHDLIHQLGYVGRWDNHRVWKANIEQRWEQDYGSEPVKNDSRLHTVLFEAGFVKVGDKVRLEDYGYTAIILNANMGSIKCQLLGNFAFPVIHDLWAWQVEAMHSRKPLPITENQPDGNYPDDGGYESD